MASDTSSPDPALPPVTASGGNEPELPLGLPRLSSSIPVQIDLLPPDVAPVQHEFTLLPGAVETPPPPLLTPEEQLAAFDRAQLGKPKTEFSRRNREILAMRSKHDDIAKIADVKQCPVPTVKWVLKMARKRAFARLVEKGRPGRKGKRQQILEALRRGLSPREVERQLGSHRTTVLRARHQLQTLTAA